MSTVYVLLYIHTDCIEYSEVLGMYFNKDDAVDSLIDYSHYREVNGVMTQYFIKTNEYRSMKELRDKVYNDMELRDVDVYKIIEYDHWK